MTKEKPKQYYHDNILKLLDEKEIIEKVRKELEKGIKRNDILPLDWAMDRISPIIISSFNQGQLSAKEEEVKFLEEHLEKVIKKRKEISGLQILHYPVDDRIKQLTEDINKIKECLK